MAGADVEENEFVGALLLVTARDLDGVPAGTDLSGRFRPMSMGVWEMRLKTPLRELKKGTITVSVKDRQGNVSKIVRTFSVAER